MQHMHPDNVYAAKTIVTRNDCGNMIFIVVVIIPTTKHIASPDPTYILCL